MANYSGCKVYIRKVDNQFDIDDILQKIKQLGSVDNIIQHIHVYSCIQSASVELRFGMKWHLMSIDEIFSPHQFDIWIISSDAGRASDYLQYFPSVKSPIEAVNERALFKFDEIELYGNTEEIHNNLDKIFGSGMHGWGEVKETHVLLHQTAIYKASNFFQYDSNQALTVYPVSSLPIFDDVFSECEFWDMIWEHDSINFKANFYQEVLDKPDSGTQFPYLQKILFKYQGQVTETIEWHPDIWSDWQHTARNGFHNLVNTSFLMFQQS